MALEEAVGVADLIDEVPDAPEADVVGDAPVESEPAADEKIHEALDDVSGDGRLISPKWRELQKSNPELFKEYKALFFGKRAYDEKLPGGMKELEETLSYLGENGGREGITQKLSEMAATADQMRELDDLFMSGNARAIDRFADMSPEGFSKLAPGVEQKWMNLDPEGWTRHTASTVATQLQHGGIPSALEKLALYLEVGQPEKAAGVLQQIQSYMGRLNEAAQAPPKTQDSSRQPADPRVERAQQAEQKAVETFQGKSNKAGWDILNAELAKHWRNDTSEGKKEITTLAVTSRVDAALKGDQTLQEKLAGLLKTGNVDSALRIYTSKVKEISEEIARKTARETLGVPAARPAPKPVAPAPKRDSEKPKDAFEAIWSR